MASASFVDATAIESDGVGARYRANVPDDWNAPVLPQGGVVAAIAARAMEHELALPEQSLRSLSVVFAAPVRSGPAEISVQVLRRGRVCRGTGRTSR